MLVSISGRSGRIRTPDHRFWRPALYQTELRSCVVPLEGLEPPTRDLGRRRSVLTELQGPAGGDRGARTPNLGIANAALSQLSYIPKFKAGMLLHPVIKILYQGPLRVKLKTGANAGPQAVKSRPNSPIQREPMFG